MAKLIIMQGLPASGKSTKAKELVSDTSGVRINRDLLREMMHFSVYSSDNEIQVINVEKVLAEEFLDIGIDVIIDDTNLKKNTVDMWTAFAYLHHVSIVFIRMDTPLEECIRRDALRSNPVGEEVIRKMHEEFNEK